MNILNSFSTERHRNSLSKSSSLPGPVRQSVASNINRIWSDLALQNAKFNTICQSPIDCPMSDEEIFAHSLLETLEIDDFPQELKELMKTDSMADAVRKIAANFAAGGLTTGGSEDPFGLDGMHGHPNFIVWEWLLSNLHQSMDGTDSEDLAIIENLLQGISQMRAYCEDLDRVEKAVNPEEELFEISLKYAEKVRQLEPGESQRFFGGWSNIGGGTGHALVYECIRNEDLTFDFFVYTATGFQLADHIFSGDKLRVKPYIQFSQIPESHLCFNGDGVTRPIFFQHFTELHALKHLDNDFVVEEEDVLEALDHLAPYQKTVDWKVSGAITGQRAGTCVPSSTKAWMRHQAGNIETHKQIMFHTKFRLIVAVYRALNQELLEDTQKGAVSRRLLNHLAKNHLRLIAAAMNKDLFGSPLLSNLLAEKAQATCYHTLKNLETCEADIHRSRMSETLENKVFHLTTSQRKVRERARKAMNAAKLSSSHKAALCGILPPFAEVSTALEIPEIVSAISRFKTRQSLKENVELLVNIQINHLIDQLPLPQFTQKPNEGTLWVEKAGNSFWENLTKDDLNNILASLEDLLIVYSGSCQNEQPSRLHTTLLSLQVLSHYLAIKIDTLKAENELPEMPRLENYRIPHIGSFLELFENIIYIDSLEFARIQEACAYFKEFEKHASSDRPLFENENTTDIVKTSVHQSLQNGKYWEKLLNSYPELANSVNALAEAKTSGGEWRKLDEEKIEKIYQDQMEKYQKDLELYNAYQKWKQESERYRGQLRGFNNGLIGTKPTHPGPSPKVVNMQPRMPQKPVNLPKWTKWIMLLEESFDLEKENPLIEYDLSHIVRIRRIIHWTNNVFHFRKFSPNDQMSAKRKNIYSYEGMVVKSPRLPLLFSQTMQDSYAASKLHRMESSTQRTFFDNQTATRNKNDWKRPIAEGVILDSTPQSLTPLMKKLLRSGSEWQLTPYQIFKAVKEQKEELTDPDLQAIIFRLLLRSPITQNQTMHIGFGEILIEDPSCYEYCSELIQEGLNHFYSTRKQFGIGENNKEFPVDGARFFLELAFYASKYLVDEGFEPQARTLLATCFNSTERWLGLNDLSQKEKAVIHLYRLLFFSLMPIEEIDCFEPYLSWTSYKINPDDKNWHSPLLQSQMEQYIITLTSQIANDLEDSEELRASIGEGLLEGLQLETRSQNVEWHYSRNIGPNVLTGRAENGDRWQIDLISGAVFGPFGKVGQGVTTFPWEDQENFKRLFRNSGPFSYQRIGHKSCTFTHPEMGVVRLVYSGREKKYVIQRQFPGFEGVWFEEKDTSNIPGYPAILAYDHTYWIPTGNGIASPSGEEITGLFSSLHTDVVQFATIGSGSIIELNQDNDQGFLEGLHVDFYETSLRNKQALTVFDLPENILAYKRQNGGESHLIKIAFPRYSSQEGNPLVFRCADGQLVWSENSEYVIPDQSPQGFLGTIPNYLYLESKNGSSPDILLVPFQKILTEQLPAPSGRLAIDNLESSIEPGNREQWGCHQYFVFQIVNGRVIPTTLEGQLFLSYLSLSQKNYREAAKWLKQIKPAQKLSPACENILKLIVSLPFGEDDPNARMVLLCAEYLSLHNKEQRANEPPEFYTGDEGISRIWNALVCAKRCLQSLNNIDADCRLTMTQESDLLAKLIESGRRNQAEIAYKLRIPSDRIDLAIMQLERRAALLQSRDLGPIGSDASELEGMRAFPKFDAAGRNRKSLSVRINFALPVSYPEPSSLEYYQKCLGEQEGTEKWVNEQERYQNYQTELETSVSWISHGTSSTLCTRPSKGVGIEKNGTLLLEAHRIAKNGSIDERKAALYRLWQWRIHSGVRNHQVMFLDLMIHMLMDPHLYGDPLDLSNDPSNEEKRAYLNGLERSYAAVSIQYIQNFLIGPIQHEVSTRSNERHYPIPDRSGLDFLQLASARKSRSRTPIDFALPSNDGRWANLQEWKSTFLREIEKTEENDYRDFLFNYHPSLLREGEEEYGEAFEHDLFSLRQDYLEGKKQNEENSVWTLSADHAHELADAARALKKELNKTIDQKVHSLLELANKPADDPDERQMEFARIGGGAAKSIAFADCVEKVLQMDIEGFEELNPHLRIDEIQKIASLTIEIEDLKSYLAQLDRIQSTAEKAAAIDDLEDPARHYQCQLLAQHLDAEYFFQPFENDLDIQVALRIFSGETEMIPHKKQVKLIKQMLKLEKGNPQRYRDIIIQLIMGGGKTSVIATIILYLAAKRSRRLALFIVPPSLFATVETNISESIWGAFKRHVESIDLNREDLSLYKLDQLVDKLNAAEENHLPIIMKATTLQTFELELLFQGRQYKKTREKFNKLKDKFNSVSNQKREIENWLRRNQRGQQAEKLQKQDRLNQLNGLFAQLDASIQNHAKYLQESKLKIIRLAEVWKRFASRGDALIDEVDLVLDCLQEVNFPDGETIPIDSTTNSLILSCFKALVNDGLYVDSDSQVSVADIVRLQENNQTLLDTHIYLNQIVPVIAENLFNTFEPVKRAVPEEFKESFIRYASNFIPAEFQEFADRRQQLNEQRLKETVPDWEQSGYTLEQAENDAAFLKFLENLYYNGSKEAKESANLIAVARHLLTEVLPATLTKSGRRHYGPSPKEESLAIIPYIGVNSPATTLFGYFLEEACYYYQWIAAFPVQKQDVIKFSQSVDAAARYYVEKNREKFEDTVEYQEFYQLFGITLDQINQPEMLERAVQTISGNIEKKLEFQFEVVAEKVGFRSERLSSNGRDLLHQVGSRRTMSGTPWNAEGFDRDLYQRFERDEGTEGKILHTMAKKVEQGQIYEVSFETVEEFFNQIFDQHPDPNKVRGIIETGGLFKAFDDNAAVAKKLMECLRERQENGQIAPDIEGVLFFHKDPGQEQSDTLYVWKKEAAHPERIGGSSKETLRAKGLDPAKYFVYYDERHTTGVDILQLPEAVNLLTFDEKMLRRTIGQGAMRLRQYLFSQNVEIVVTQGTRKLIVNEGKNTEDFILTAEKNQSIRKTGHMVRYFRQQVDGAARDLAVERIVNAALALDHEGAEEAFIEEIANNEPFFVTKTHDQFYLSHGKLRPQVETKAMLLEQLENKVDQLTDRINDLETRQAIIKEKEALAQHIQNTNCLPLLSTQNPSSIGVEQEVEMQVQLESNHQILLQNELEQELKLELEHYERKSRRNLLSETKMSREEFLNLIQLVYNRDEISHCMISLQNQLASFEYGLFENRIHYENAFHEPIYGTHAFFNTLQDSALPVFHQLQRPPEQVLAVRTAEGRFHWLLLFPSMKRALLEST